MLLFFALPASAAITKVQSCNSCSAASTAAAAVGFASNLTAGNLVVVMTAISSQTVTVSSVVGCSSEAGVLAKRQVNTLSSVTAEIWYILSTAGGCSTVTINYSSSISQQPRVVEFTGCTNCAKDLTDGASQTTSTTDHPASASTLTPSVDNALVVTASRTNGTGTSGSHAVSPDFTEEFDNGVSYFQYLIETTATATDGSWTSLATTSAANAMVSFKIGSAASGCTGGLLLFGVGGCDQ